MKPRVDIKLGLSRESEKKRKQDVYGSKLACVAGAKRRGREGKGKGASPSPIPFPFFPSSLSPTPYPFRRLLRRLGQSQI